MRKLKETNVIKFAFAVLMSCLLNSAVQVHAQSEVRALSLQQCFETALENNLTVQIERVNPELSLYDLRVSEGAYDPSFFFSYRQQNRQEPGRFDPTIGNIPGSSSETDSFSSGISGQLPTGTQYSFQTFVSETEVNNAGFSFNQFSGNAAFSQLRQPLLKNLWIDGARYNIKLSKNRLTQSDLALQWQMMNVLTQVELAYYDLIAAQENVKVQEKAVQLADRLLAENKKRVEIGTMAPLDEKQAQSQVAARRADLLGARRTLIVRQNALKNLLSQEYADWASVSIQPSEGLRAVPVVTDLQDSWHKGLTQRPDLLQSKKGLENQGILVKFRRNQLFPQLDLVGSIGYAAQARNGSYSDVFDQITGRDNPVWSVGAELSVPLTRRQERYNFKSAKAQAEQLKLTFKRSEQQIMVDIENAVSLTKINLQRVEATRQEREFAEAALDAEQKKLEVGKSTSFIVLQLQRDLTAARSSEINALAEYNKALSQLSLSEGSVFDRHSIDVDVVESDAQANPLLEPVYSE
jgi:outer membrane protein TolC